MDLVVVRTSDDALAEAKRCAVIGRIKYSRHARKRMDERGARAADVKASLQSARQCRAGKRTGTWAITGTDLDGDPLLVVVAIEFDTVIVTLYEED